MQRAAITSIVCFLACLPAVADAGNVAVKGVHLCCGACVSAVSKALKPVDGVTGIACDRDSKRVTFQARDDKAAQAGIVALAMSCKGDSRVSSWTRKVT